MKRTVFSLLLFMPLLSFGQYSYGFLQEFYFARQPSARAEAMGKSYSANDGDLAAIFYNPAGTFSIKGAELNTSYSTGYYSIADAQSSFISAGYNINQYFTVGLSRNHFTLGQELIVFGENGIFEHIPTTSLYTLNLSSQPIKNLLIGLNTNYLIWDPVDETASSVYVDFGLIKKFQFAQHAKRGHLVNLGASISNLNGAKLEESDFAGGELSEELPTIMRFGINYQFYLDKDLVLDTLNTLTISLQGDYQLLTNSDYHVGFYSGIELLFLEMLAFRLGYYEESHSDFGFKENKDRLSDFTYGLGMQIPLYKLTALPLNLNVDYTSLPHPSLLESQEDFDNFSTFTLRVNWIIGR